MAYIGNVVTSFNVATQNINNDAITTEKIADGAILNADVNSAAAIAGTKISPDFGSQNIATTGLFSHALGAAVTPSITFTGDPNTGIYSPGADQVAISTNGTGRLFVDSAGNVGVGTTTAPGSNGKGVAIYDASFPRLSFRNSTTGDANTDGTQMLMNGSNFIIANTENGYTSFENNGTERMRLTSAGLLGIGTTTPGYRLSVSGGATSLAANDYLRFGDGRFASGDGSVTNYLFTGSSALAIRNNSDSTEFARFDNSGRFLVGTSNARGNFQNGAATCRAQIEGTDYQNTGLAIISNDSSQVQRPILYLYRSNGSSVGSNTLVASGDICGQVIFGGNDGTEFVNAAVIAAEIDGTPGANDMPGRLVFSTTRDGQSSPEEKIRVTNDGFTVFKATTANGSTTVANSDTYFFPDASFGQGLQFGNTYGGGKGYVGFRYNSSAIGQISATGTSGGTATGVAYITTSDYRLKENVVPLTGAIDRLCQLQAHRFNFIADPDKTVDGFLAHEAQTVVPECATGIKDEVDAGGNPKYQGIDQSKLVPLLTAALQEAIGRIETLEAEITALKAS